MLQDKVVIADVTPIGEGLISSFIILGNDKTAVVDPGPINGYRKLKDKLGELGVEPDYIIPTHIHLDHGGAACRLARDYPGSKVYVHPRGARHLVDPSKLWNASKNVLGPVADAYGEPVPCEESIILETRDGEKLDLGGLTVEFIHTPGHASHHQSIWVPEISLMLSGDSAGVILPRGEGRAYIPTTPPPFRLDFYTESIRKMMSFAPSYIGPTHYGIYDGAVEYLERHLEQIQVWVYLAVRLVEKGETSPEAFLEEVRKIDDNAVFFLENENPIVQGSFIHTTAVGLMDYAVKLVRENRG